MSIDKAGWIIGLALGLVACHERDCGQGQEHTIVGMREG